MLPMSLMPLVQVPVALGMFFGVEHLCALPLEQFLGAVSHSFLISRSGPILRLTQ
ncbi:hypothetical protein BGY98DRAFT_1010159 [Russula aff. rugulosa BPL654]|nr:hypothetical protein BGY98DRAFT_1010159 [Russula aff. rugulosa BPL654]